MALVEMGIRANPDYWRLYFTLGFIHFWDRKDYKAAQQAFEKGSENPKALYWMKVMAASMAQRANDPNTAILLWKGIQETVEDKTVQKNAQEHLNALYVDQFVPELERRVELFRQRTGRLPSTWLDLLQERLVPGIPLDPNKKPYRLMPDGTVQVENPDSLPFITRGLPPEAKKSAQP